MRVHKTLQSLKTKKKDLMNMQKNVRTLHLMMRAQVNVMSMKQKMMNMKTKSSQLTIVLKTMIMMNMQIMMIVHKLKMLAYLKQ